MISAVVCTYNRGPTLRRMLDSFFAQTCRDSVEHELLVVNNNSTDGTADLLDSYAANHPVRVIFEERQGLCVARNRGIDESRGDIIAFLDDDVLMHPEWLSLLQRAFDETGADVVGGRTELVIDSVEPEWLGPRFRRNLSELDLGDERRPLKDGEMLFGLNMAFRRDVFEAHGRFDERLDRKGSGLLGGGDTAFIEHVRQRGASVFYDPEAMVGHIIAPDRLEWDYFARLSFQMGRSLAIPEQHDAFPVRLFRAVRSLATVLLARTHVWRAHLTGGSAYRRKEMRSKLLMEMGRRAQRWRSVLGRGAGPD